LRKEFRAIPKEQARCPSAFRDPRLAALSWLERSEQAAEVEDQFMRFMDLVQRPVRPARHQNRAWGDREAMGTLTAIWNLDADAQIRSFCAASASGSQADRDQVPLRQVLGPAQPTTMITSFTRPSAACCRDSAGPACFLSCEPCSIGYT